MPYPLVPPLMNLCFYKLRVIIIPSVDRVACFPPPPLWTTPCASWCSEFSYTAFGYWKCFWNRCSWFLNQVLYHCYSEVNKPCHSCQSCPTMQTWVLSNLLHQTMTIFFLKQPTILLLHLRIHDLNMRDILVRLKPLPLLQDLRHNLPVPLFHLSLGPYMLKHLRWQMLV